MPTTQKPRTPAKAEGYPVVASQAGRQVERFLEALSATRIDDASLDMLRPALRVATYNLKDSEEEVVRRALFALILVGLSKASINEIQEVARVVDMQLRACQCPAEKFIGEAIDAHYRDGIDPEWVEWELAPENGDGFAVNFRESLENHRRFSEMHASRLEKEPRREPA